MQLHDPERHATAVDVDAAVAAGGYATAAGGSCVEAAGGAGRRCAWLPRVGCGVALSGQV